MTTIKGLLPDRLGFGTAALGNKLRAVSPDEATATVEALWDHGIRYFDTAPSYGAGLAETRLGEVLSTHCRDEFVLSTKVGRIVLDEVEDLPSPSVKQEGRLFEHGRPNKVVPDYSADATLRSIEDSLGRLRTDRLDIVWVHDIAQDFCGHSWLGAYASAWAGAFRVLHSLREQGVIKAWGMCVNRVEPVELLLDVDEPAPDAFLLGGRYTLLDHERAFQRLLPEAVRRDVDVVVSGPYSSGILAGGQHFEHRQAPGPVTEKVRHIKDVAERYGVSVKAAALQFPLAHPAVRAVIPGGTRPSRIAEDVAAFRETVPLAFWAALWAEGIIGSDILALSETLATTTPPARPVHPSGPVPRIPPPSQGLAKQRERAVVPVRRDSTGEFRGAGTQKSGRHRNAGYGSDN